MKRKADEQLQKGKKPLGIRRTVLAKRIGVVGAAPATRGFGPLFGSHKGEKKFFDGGSVAIGQPIHLMSSPGSYDLCFAPAAGTGFDQRIGRKTTATQIYIRGIIGVENAMYGPALSGNPSFTAPGVAGQAPCQQMRMILFVDLQPNGNVPAANAVLAGGTPGPSAQLNPDNRDRFKILKDKVWVFDPVTSSTTAATVFNRTCASLKIFKKLPNIETIFNSTNTGTNTISDINTGAIYLLWVGDQPEASTPFRGLARYRRRVRFIDN